MKPQTLGDLESTVSALPVPAFDFGAIQARVGHLRARSVAARRTMIAASGLVIVLSSLAAATGVFTHFNVSHRFGTWQVYGPRAVINTHPTQGTLDRLAHGAPYPVTWPTAFPKGTTLRMVGSMASQLVILEYHCPNKGTSRFTIMPNTTYASDANLRMWVSSLKINPGIDREWQVGQERVRVQTNCLTLNQIQTIRSAMIAERKSVPPKR